MSGRVAIVQKISFNTGTIDLRSGGYTKTGMILVHPGDLLISGINAAKGAIALYDGECKSTIAATIRYGAYQVVRAKADPHFLWWSLRSDIFRQILGRSLPGGIKTELKAKRLLPIRIPLPPLEEQRRIGQRIAALSEKITQARSLQSESLKAVAALSASVAGEAMADATRRYGDRSLGSFDPVVTSGPRNWAEKCGQGAIRFYRAQDLGPDGRISHKSRAFISPPENGQARAAKLVSGDVMMVITGATVGRCAVYSGSNEPGYVNQHVALCRLPQSDVDPGFARWALLSPQGQDQLLGKRYGQGKPGLNLTNIRQLTIPAVPLDEQRRIVQRLESTAEQMSALRSAQISVSDALESLLPSVLNHAFSGQL